MRQVIDKWPSAEALGRDLGVSGLVVRQWRARGSIPARYWRRLVRAAEKRGIAEATLADLARLADAAAETTA